MRADKLINLVLAGGQDKARQVLKKASLAERLPVLRDMVPTARVEPKLLAFLRANFVLEVGALAQSGWDADAAEKLYNNSKA